MAVFPPFWGFGRAPALPAAAPRAFSGVGATPSGANPRLRAFLRLAVWLDCNGV
jgi:hypothetical protein